MAALPRSSKVAQAAARRHWNQTLAKARVEPQTAGANEDAQMPQPKPKPAKIHRDDIPWRESADAPTKVRIKRLVTRGRHGSEPAFFVYNMYPSQE
jgi:hypothetical protein